MSITLSYFWVKINLFYFSRYEETNTASDVCRPDQQCVGGYGRVVTMVRHLLNTHNTSIYLNAGDNFQGTLWYNVGRWNVTTQFLNLLPADAIVNQLIIIN